MTARAKRRATKSILWLFKSPSVYFINEHLIDLFVSVLFTATDGLQRRLVVMLFNYTNGTETIRNRR